MYIKGCHFLNEGHEHLKKERLKLYCLNLQSWKNFGPFVFVLFRENEEYMRFDDVCHHASPYTIK